MLEIFPIFSAFSVLLVLFLSGYLYSSALFPPESCKGHIGCSIILGSWTYIILLNFFPNISPLEALFLNLLFCGVVGSIMQYRFHSDRIFIFTPGRIGKSELLVLSAILLFYLLVVWRFVGYDEIFNFSFASQVRDGKIPPSMFGFPDAAASYHYGWGILLGSMSYITAIPLPAASDILTLYVIGGCVLLVFQILENIGVSRQGRLWGAFFFLLGGGFFVLPYLLIFDSWRNGMGTVTMLQSHPWTFGFGLFLTAMACVSTFNKEKSPSIWPYILLGMIPVLCLPFINATSMSFVLVSLAILAGYFLLKSFFGTANAVKHSLWCIAGMILFSFGWLQMGGVFSVSRSISNGEFPIGFSPLTLGGELYIKYMLSYILLGLPGFVGFFLSIYFIYKKKLNTINLNPALFVCMGLCLMLYPLPFVVWLKPIAAWDNLCKFSYFGVLAGLILIIFWFDRYVLSGTSRRFQLAVMVVLTLVFCHESFILMARFQYTDEHAAYYNETQQRANLISVIRDRVSLDDRIIAINRECDGFYSSEKMSGQKTNLYRYLGIYFSEFFIVAKETGAAIVNFEILTTAYPNTPKGDLLRLLQLAHEGPMPIEKLSSAEIRYILCMIEKVPEYVKTYEKKNLISMIQSDTQEGWILWKIN